METRNDDKRLKYTVVIGNGFDLDLGFNTRYSDFVESEEWKRMYDERSKVSKKNSLLHYLNGKRYIDEWFDIEQALYDYVSRRQDGTFVNNVEIDKKDYEYVCKALTEYLNNHLKNNPHDLNATNAGKFLDALCNLYGTVSIDRRVYSFNYTSLDFYAKRLFTYNHIDVDFIHGKIENNSIILGIEVDNIAQIAPGYSFLIKSNSISYASSNLPADLLNSKEVVFYGHSMNSIDIGYFEEFFHQMEVNSDETKQISIITYDDDSKRAFFDSLRKNHIDVRKLFTHTAINVIRTKRVKEDENSEDSKAFHNLLNRLR